MRNSTLFSLLGSFSGVLTLAVGFMIEATFLPEAMLWWHWGILAVVCLVGVIYSGWRLYQMEADTPSVKEQVENALRSVLSENGKKWESEGRMIRYRTRHGDLQVRLKSVYQAQKDIAEWLEKNDLFRDEEYRIRISDDNEYDENA